MLRVHVGGLAPEVRSEELRELASKCGRVTAVDILTSEFDGMSRGFGFVNMANQDGVSKLLKYDKALWRGGRRLRVELAKPDYRERMRLERTAENHAAAKPHPEQHTVVLAPPTTKPVLRGIPRHLGEKTLLDSPHYQSISVPPSSDRFRESERTDNLSLAAEEEASSMAVFRELAGNSSTIGSTQQSVPRREISSGASHDDAAATEKRREKKRRQHSGSSSHDDADAPQPDEENRSHDDEDDDDLRLSLAAEEEASMAVFRELAGNSSTIGSTQQSVSQREISSGASHDDTAATEKRREKKRRQPSGSSSHDDADAPQPDEITRSHDDEDDDNNDDNTDLNFSLAAEEEASMAVFRELAGSLATTQPLESVGPTSPASVEDASGAQLLESTAEREKNGATTADVTEADSARDDDDDGRRQWTALRNVFSVAPVKSFEGGLALSFAASGGVVEHKFNFGELPSPPPEETPSKVAEEEEAGEPTTTAVARAADDRQEEEEAPGRDVFRKKTSLWASVDEGVEEGRRAIGETDVDAVEARWNESRGSLRQTYRRILRKMQARKRRRTF